MSRNVLVDETHLMNIAQAIRSKGGTTRTYKPSEMAAAISGFNVSEGSFAEDVTRLAVEMQYLLPREAEDGEY